MKLILPLVLAALAGLVCVPGAAAQSPDAMTPVTEPPQTEEPPPTTTSKPRGSVSDYRARLASALALPGVRELSPTEVAQYAANSRDEYLEHFELAEKERESVRNFTKIDTDLLKPHGYRYIPDAESVGKLNVEVPDLSALAKPSWRVPCCWCDVEVPDLSALAKLSQSEALWLLEQSRAAVAEDVRAVYDPLFQEDYQWHFDQKFKEIERAIRGRDTDRMEDWSCRAAQSFSVRMLRSVGLREVADEVALEFFPENPKYDSRHSSKLVSGAGDFAAVAVIAVVLGSVFLFFLALFQISRPEVASSRLNALISRLSWPMGSRMQFGRERDSRKGDEDSACDGVPPWQGLGAGIARFPAKPGFQGERNPLQAIPQPP